MANQKNLNTQEIFDPEKVLKVLDGDVNLLREITGIFMESSVSDMETLQQAIAAWNSEKIQQEAHKIKGAAANIGAERVRALALEMEHSARQEDLSKTRCLFETLQKEMGKFEELLKQYAWESLG